MLDSLALAMLNHLLVQAGGACAHLKPFSGKTVQIRAMPWHLALCLDEDGLFAETGHTLFDATIDISTGIPWVQSGSADKPFSTAHITGPAEFTAVLDLVLRNLRWDFEEDLSHLVGDILAHRMANGFRDAVAWQQDARRRLEENLADYLVMESNTIVSRFDLTHFSSQVTHLTHQVDDLEHRIGHLMPGNRQ